MVEVDSSSPFAINEAGLTDIERLGGGFQRLLHAHFIGEQRFRLRPKTVEFVVKLGLDVTEMKKLEKRWKEGRREKRWWERKEKKWRERRKKWQQLLLNFIFAMIN